MAERKPKSGRSKTSPEFLALISEETEAFKMRRGGASLQTIADHQGVTVSCACRRVQRGLEQAKQEHAAEAGKHLTLEISRLEEIIAGMWPKIAEGNSKSAEAALKAMERKARLLGYEPPKEFKFTTPGEALSFAAQAMGLDLETVAAAVTTAEGE